MRLCRAFVKDTYRHLWRKSKAIVILVWNNIKRIRNLPSWARATIVLILYTLATKPIEQFAEVLGKMNNLVSSNMTAFAEYLTTSSKDIWILILQVVIIILFVAFSSWLWGSDNKKDIQALKNEMKKNSERIIKEIRKGRPQ